MDVLFRNIYPHITVALETNLRRFPVVRRVRDKPLVGPNYILSISCSSVAGHASQTPMGGENVRRVNPQPLQFRRIGDKLTEPVLTDVAGYAFPGLGSPIIQKDRG
jgi:hypothetical protein